MAIDYGSVNAKPSRELFDSTTLTHFRCEFRWKNRYENLTMGS